MQTLSVWKSLKFVVWERVKSSFDSSVKKELNEISHKMHLQKVSKPWVQHPLRMCVQKNSPAILKSHTVTTMHNFSLSLQSTVIGPK